MSFLHHTFTKSVHVTARQIRMKIPLLYVHKISPVDPVGETWITIFLRATSFHDLSLIHPVGQE